MKIYNWNPIIVMGKPKSGKTEASKFLAEVLKCKRASCSNLLYEIAMIVKTGQPCGQVTPQQIADFVQGFDELGGKEWLRPMLVALGNHLTEEDPSYLVRVLCNRGCRVIDGVRRQSELREFLTFASRQFMTPLCLWVDRPGIEDITDNTEVSSADADVIVTNDGDLEHLREQLQGVLAENADLLCY